MTMPAHLARKNRNQRMNKEWKPPFEIGYTQRNKTLVAVEHLGSSAADTTYRVLNLTCGHESVITHRWFQANKKKSGLCVSCTRQEVSSRKDTQQTPSTSGPKDLWVHNLWNNSLGMG